MNKTPNIKPALSATRIDQDERVLAAREKAQQVSARLTESRAAVTAAETLLRDDGFLGRATGDELERLLADAEAARLRIPALEAQERHATLRQRSVAEAVNLELGAAVVERVLPELRERVAAVHGAMESALKGIRDLREFYRQVNLSAPGLNLEEAGLPMSRPDENQSLRLTLLMFVRRRAAYGTLADIIPASTVEVRW